MTGSGGGKAALALAFVVMLAPSVALAQESTPPVTCTVPGLVVGTPTTGDAETSAAISVGHTTGTPESEAAMLAATETMANLVACINGGHYLAAGQLMTTSFIQNSLGASAVELVPATFEGVQEMRIRALTGAELDDDGTLSVGFSSMRTAPTNSIALAAQRCRRGCCQMRRSSR